MSLESHWYRRSVLSYLLLPLQWLFRLITSIRRKLYALGVLSSEAVNVPVLIVGNINIGGTGKTPLVQWLIQTLKEAGFNPGVVSRGYGAACTSFPHAVDIENDTAQFVGDEPFLLATSCRCPLVIDPVRTRAARQLLALDKRIDVIVSDDGLQHYALKRDIEIVVVDGVRGFGNGFCLPAGPLREPVSRIRQSNYLVSNGPSELGQDSVMSLVAQSFCSLDEKKELPLNSFAGKTADVFAGIGNPQRFYKQLERLGIMVKPHAVRDHQAYEQNQFDDCSDLIIMTEKDAVKCRAFNLSNAWFLKIKADLSPSLATRLVDDIKRVQHEKTPT